MQETGLFLTFAHLDGTDAEFLRFANTYGRLGTYHYYFPGSEPLEEWQRHHRWMQFLALLRSELLEHPPGLKKHVSWDGNEIVYRFPKIGTSSTESWRHRGELRESPLNKEGLPLFKRGDLRGPAWWFLVFSINKWLQELDDLDTPIAPRMVWSELDRRPQCGGRMGAGRAPVGHPAPGAPGLRSGPGVPWPDCLASAPGRGGRAVAAASLGDRPV